MREIPSIADLIATEEKWTKGAWARDEEGQVTACWGELAKCFCLDGALLRLSKTCDDPPLAPSYAAVIDAIKLEFPEFATNKGNIVAAFNDDPHTSHADVLRVARRADELIRERLEAAP